MALDLEHIQAIARRVAETLGLELVDVEFGGGGKARMLRVTIDKPGAVKPGAGEIGVTHEDCANVSREMSTILDVEDAVPGAAYTLEVSSPGLDRKLNRAADYVRFTGSLVKLMTREPVNNNRHFEGRLQGFTDGKLTLDVSDNGRRKKKGKAVEGERKIEIELANVERANLIPEI